MKLSKKLVIRYFGHKKICHDFDFRNVKSILIRPVGDAVGDAVAHIAYIRQLKAIYPGVRIGVIVTDRNHDIYAYSHEVDELIKDKTIDYLKQRGKWQLFLDFYCYFNSRHIMADRLLKPEAVMIFNKINKAYYTTENVLNYDFHCPMVEGNHIVDALKTSKIAEYFEIPPGRFFLQVVEAQSEQAKDFWQQGKIRVLLAPQGSICDRQIPPQELAQLLNRCDSESIETAQFLLCNARNSEAYLAELKQYCRVDIEVNLVPKTTLHQYLQLVASSDVVVCIDSGTVHVACAFNRPLLAFYANFPSNFRLWHPLPNKGVPHLTVISGLAEESKRTSDFPLNEAVVWLSEQIGLCNKRKRC
ncbi:glycosyltransferase family 9 protein [Uruburuella testudinis]|uniref:Glycosyltransferase family 9 protein n=1 Tax=Uruburuella testudinis TaxID=1282863 RepID=A0ABY4DU12_9NEIS|nr:glycosyltransferase family 9 protein [Uruburuella testudinis]UOO82531.1 glycosyltransferase family 9 protein [Uruburuella testudinis]